MNPGIRSTVVVFGLFFAVLSSAAEPEMRTMRLDYFHTGNVTGERFALDGAVLEGAWPGPRNRMIDDTNSGNYFFEVSDPASNRILYSRGYASIFGEWETTAEAKNSDRTFHESLRFPLPAGPVRIVIKKRSQNGFRQVWSIVIDPKDPSVDRTRTGGKVWAVMQNGAPRDKVDLLLMGDGYTDAEMNKWHHDANRAADLLFAVSPFKERKKDFNVWAVDTPAEESGVMRPSDGIYRHSPLRTSYDAFGSERYVLAFDNKRLREAAAVAPYEFIEILVNDRKYGGGGIFNLYSVAAAGNGWLAYLLVHEFGHHFAGLGDEYYTSDVAYEASQQRPEPWEPNITNDPQGRRWKDLMTSRVPLPTPWPKEAFEAEQKEAQGRRAELRKKNRPEEEMEALFSAEQKRTTGLLRSGEYAGKVGAFEGAMYEAKGYYRPQVDCIMFTRDDVGFCAVCRRAIERIIDFYTGK